MVHDSSVRSETLHEREEFVTVHIQREREREREQYGSNFEKTDYFKKWIGQISGSQRQSLYDKIGSSDKIPLSFSPETVLVILDYLYDPENDSVSGVMECEVCKKEIIGHTKYVENVIACPNEEKFRNKETNKNNKFSIIIKEYEILAKIMSFLKFDIMRMVGFIGSLSHGLRIMSPMIGSDFGLTNDDIRLIFNKSTITQRLGPKSYILIPKFLRLPVLSDDDEKKNMFYPCSSNCHKIIEVKVN